jgi:hypothetical protein
MGKLKMGDEKIGNLNPPDSCGAEKKILFRLFKF